VRLLTTVAGPPPSRPHNYLLPLRHICSQPQAGTKKWRTLLLIHRRLRLALRGKPMPIVALRPPLAIRAARHRLDPLRGFPTAESSCRFCHRRWHLVTADLLLLVGHSLWEERRRRRPCHHRIHLGVPPSAVVGEGQGLRRRLSLIVAGAIFLHHPFTLGT